MPLFVFGADGLGGMSADARDWAGGIGFSGGLGQVLTVPNADGGIGAALVGYGTTATRVRGRFHVGAAARKLPQGTYAIATDLSAAEFEEAALGWLFSSYRFDQYIRPAKAAALLVAPNGIDAARIATIATG